MQHRPGDFNLEAPGRVGEDHEDHEGMKEEEKMDKIVVELAAKSAKQGLC